MARGEDEFDHDDDMPRKSGGSFPVWAILLICAIPLAVIAIGVLGWGFFAVRPVSQPPVAQEAMAVDVAALGGPNRAKKVYTRDEFMALVGSTPEDLLVWLERTNKVVEGLRATWVYHNRSKDSATGRIDFVTKVVFEWGVVVEINFQAVAPPT